ncbi:MAG: hypothetical protein BWX93_01955 [Bacteroidetes bacterium ADurb.Bin139]|nr:MAG: hypothetical protein BWX93_01955 [Bacteroidetes bacterium ADurb.Bin139]
MGQGGVIVPMRNKKNVVPEAVAGAGKIQSQPGVDQIIYSGCFSYTLVVDIHYVHGTAPIAYTLGGDLECGKRRARTEVFAETENIVKFVVVIRVQVDGFLLFGRCRRQIPVDNPCLRKCCSFLSDFDQVTAHAGSFGVVNGIRKALC